MGNFISAYPELENQEFKKIRQLYHQLPQTTCAQCGDCCKQFTPHIFYIELLNIYRHFFSAENNFSFHNQIVTMVTQMYRNYFAFSQEPTPCPFYQKNKCVIYEVRPYNCRMYGIVEPQEWENRTRRPGEVYLEQCHKVKTSTKINYAKTNKIFRELNELNDRICTRQGIDLEQKYLSLSAWIMMSFIQDQELQAMECLREDFEKNPTHRDAYLSKIEEIYRFDVSFKQFSQTNNCNYEGTDVNR